LPPAGELHFNILRQGKPFGQRGVVFVKDGETLNGQDRGRDALQDRRHQHLRP
jgi:hypothetical protein